MDETIIRFLQGKASDEEEERLRQWRRASPANEDRYREIARLWRLAEAARPAVAGSRVPSPEEIIAAAEDRGSGAYRPARQATGSSGPGHWGAVKKVAASIAVAAALLVLGAGLGRFVVRDASPPLFGATEVVTGPLEKATVRLRDGSLVRLAPDSRMRVTGEVGEREVWVDGRAYFSVVEVDGETFRVKTRAGTAHVLGTRFAVDVRADTLRLTVEEGSVLLGSGGAEVEVRAGQTSIASGGTNPSVTRPVETRIDLRWMDGFLAFQSTPLTRAVREIEQRFDIEVRILDDALEKETVTAWFTDQSAEQVLDTVCRIVGAHCTVNNGLATVEP